MKCPASKAIAHLRDIQDEVEYAGRGPGEIVCLSRKATNAILSDLRTVARLIRQMSDQS